MYSSCISEDAPRCPSKLHHQTHTLRTWTLASSQIPIMSSVNSKWHQSCMLCHSVHPRQLRTHNRHSLKSNGQLDFSDPAAVQQLTRSLLERDFGLKLDLPDDRLCPPVPNRYIYLCLIRYVVYTDEKSQIQLHSLDPRACWYDCARTCWRIRYYSRSRGTGHVS